MRRRRSIGLFLSATLVTAVSARAQDAPADGGPQVTPYMFLGSNSSSGAGAAVRWPLRGPLSLELETNHRQSDVSPWSANLSLLYDLPQLARVTPYVAGGIGLDQYAFADTSLTGHFVSQVGTALSVNAGG